MRKNVQIREEIIVNFSGVCHGSRGLVDVLKLQSMKIRSSPDSYVLAENRRLLCSLVVRCFVVEESEGVKTWKVVKAESSGLHTPGAVWDVWDCRRVGNSGLNRQQRSKGP